MEKNLQKNMHENDKNTFWFVALDKQRTFYQQSSQRVRKIKEEGTRSEENNSSGMKIPESFDFEDMWNFNHPHLNV